MSHFRVLIVGAGAAGIAAASRLAERGMSDFAILEAENRLGGRLYTTSIGKDVLELGAEWIHGEKDNVVYEQASTLNLVDNTTDCTKFVKCSYFNSSGNQVDLKVSEALSKIFYDIIEFENQDMKGFQGSLGEYIKARYIEEVEQLRKEIDITPEIAKQFLDVFHKWENSIDGSASWYETSAIGHLEYWECEGNILTVWKSGFGYKTILDVLTRRYPDPNEELPVYNKIFFNKEVSKIKYNANPLNGVPDVSVECADGAFYTANHVILTCSLGVLKEKAVKLFSPPLPQDKLNCIEGLGFGTVDKIFLKFSQPWWTDDIYGFSFLWSDEEKSKDASGWLSDVICFHPINDDSNILRGWIVGDAARFMETLSDKEVLDGLLLLFKKFLGSKYNIPQPVALLRSKWYTNPHFRGSYSCRLLKSDRMNVWSSQLSKPVCNVREKPLLLFAGEATHSHYFSTVHGAIESGQREADRLLSTAQFHNGIKSQYKVIIIGAGVSGLAAAKTLVENGITDILIVESQVQPGGRICSMKINDDYFELGAQWIHGEKNEICKISQENNLLTDVVSQEGDGLYLREDGSVVDKELVRNVDDFVKNTLESCEIYSKSEECANIPRSIGEVLNLEFTKYLNSKREDADEVKLIKKELFDWHVRFQKIDNSCNDLNELSAKAWGFYEFCGGKDCINFKNGYSSLINVLIKSLPENIFLYSTPVRRVEWAQEIHERRNGCIDKPDFNCNVEIICDNDMHIKSEYLIVTSSLGFLKENHEKMFHPPLPKFLSQAINKIGFGVMDKIFLIYDEPWWDPYVKGFQLVWSLESNKHQWARDITGFDVISHEKPILLGWVGGEGAMEMEKMTEEDLAEELTEILRNFTKNLEIPLPKKVLRSQWWRNEFVRGGYSHITVNCDDDRINGTTLAQPAMTNIYRKDLVFEKPTILLAGESVHKTHYSTVHGAFESGQSQARVIFEDIKSSGQK